MKNWFILVFGLLLIILNVGMFFCPYKPAQYLTFALSTIGAIILIVNQFKIPSSQTNQQTTNPTPPRAEAEIIAMLALLQDKGRLIDFLMEDITKAEDTQIAAATRVVHAGCKKVLMENFEWERVHNAAEGSTVELKKEYDASSYRLIGSVPEHPPYKGKLVHAGWKVKSVRLPKVIGGTSEHPWPVVAPAEVEIQS
ncbi:MAG: DUF2760 domain-containing protein [Chthoniobacterales bacterium]|nr:DUF2760 domain-containing protein [Chthoniobacterales bacterium]